MSFDDSDDLDEYLDEFADEILSAPAGPVAGQGDGGVAQGAPASSQHAHAPQHARDEHGELNRQIENTLRELEDESPELKQQLEQLMRSLGQGVAQAGAGVAQAENVAQAGASVAQEAGFKQTIASTLNRLKESGGKVDQSIKAEQAPDKMLEQLLSQLNLDGSADGEAADGLDANLNSLISEMLDQLVSKDILYQPMKDLSVKYPQWIDDNRSGLSRDQLASYSHQLDLINAIIAQFEHDDYSDDDPKTRETISDKLEQLQAAGDPPQELMGDLNKVLPSFGDPADGLNFNISDEDVPKELEKDLEGCVQQ